MSHDPQYRLYDLNKVILSITHDAESFLNGLTSNDMDQPRNAFLNIHGKIVATFDQIKVGDDAYFLLIEDSFIDDVLDHMERYLKIGQTRAHIEKQYGIFFDLEDTYLVDKDEFMIPQNKGKIVISRLEPTLPEYLVSSEEFTLFRLKNNIPLHGVDYRDEFLLNVSMDEFVSFTKGCYLGQEPVSKVYNRSQPTWKLTVRSEDECSEEEKQKMTSRTLDPATGKSIGFVFAKNE